MLATVLRDIPLVFTCSVISPLMRVVISYLADNEHKGRQLAFYYVTPWLEIYVRVHFWLSHRTSVIVFTVSHLLT